MKKQLITMVAIVCIAWLVGGCELPKAWCHCRLKFQTQWSEVERIKKVLVDEMGFESVITKPNGMGAAIIIADHSYSLEAD